MDRTYTLYKHVNKINGKTYVGITINKPEKRWGTNGANYSECPYFWNAIQEYGWDNFDHIVVEQGLSRDDAAERERQLISELETRNPKYGYNLAAGGYSQPGEDNPFWGHKHTDAVKAAVAESNKRRVWTEESKQKVKEKLSGGNSPCAKPVKCVETGIVYPTGKEAAKAVGVQPSKICSAARGYHKTSAGFHWQYV